MSDDNNAARKRAAMAHHIFPSAATLLGVCATLVGLIKVMEPSTGPSNVDQYVAIPGLIFLFSAISSYISIRFDGHSAAWYCEKVADLFFLIGLVALALIALFFAYELI